MSLDGVASMRALHGERSAFDWSDTADLLSMRVFERAVDLLRFSRHRLSAFRLRVHGATPGFGALLVSRALGDLGCAARLPGGDIVFFCVASCDVANAEDYDACAEQKLIDSLSDTLAGLCAGGAGARILLSVAHVWSDEVCDARELVALLTRVAPKTDIAALAPVFRAHDARDAWSGMWAQRRQRAAVV